MPTVASADKSVATSGRNCSNCTQLFVRAVNHQMVGVLGVVHDFKYTKAIRKRRALDLLGGPKRNGWVWGNLVDSFQ